MSEASFASLGPTLLARKGGAKPAMRPQLAPLPEAVADDQLEDLGWNDMGADDDPIVHKPSATASKSKHNSKKLSKSADIVSINPSATALPAYEAANEIADDFGDSQEPLIKAKPAAKKPASKAKKAKKKGAKTVSQAGTSNLPRRTAFTLRLDLDRHLKLRLASTMQGVSAQALVTEAIDQMFAEIDDLDALVSRMKRH